MMKYWILFNDISKTALILELQSLHWLSYYIIYNKFM